MRIIVEICVYLLFFAGGIGAGVVFFPLPASKVVKVAVHAHSWQTYDAPFRSTNDGWFYQWRYCEACRLAEIRKVSVMEEPK